LENDKTTKGNLPLAKPASRKPSKRKVVTKLLNKVSEEKSKKANDKVEPNVKVVRDSFTMPQSDYAKLGKLKQMCLKAGLQVKKSEFLRAGLLVLDEMSATQLKKTIAKIEQRKTGRPKKN
jgi:hypothetical protein